MKKLIVATSFAMALSSGPAYAGVEMKMVTKDRTGAVAHRTSLLTQDGKVRMDNISDSDDSNISTIFAGDHFVVVEHSEKRFFVIDQAMLDQVSSQISAAMAQMQEQLANLPPEQRAMAEQMMKGQMQQLMGQSAPEKIVTPSGTGEWQSSACRKYSVMEGPNLVQEICATALDNIDGADEAMEAFRGMADYVNKMIESMPMGEAVGFNPGELLDDIDGFPVVTTDYKFGRVIGITTLESANEKTLDGSVFSVPEGYEEETLVP